MAEKSTSFRVASGGTNDELTKDGVNLSMKPARSTAPSMTVRARRRREEAVRRLVADVQTKTDHFASGEEMPQQDASQHDWLVASTVATALEKGLDRDLHAELVQEAKDNAGRIGQVCHDHADVFLQSVAQVAALGEPSSVLADGLKTNHQELTTNTAGPMLHANLQWEQARQSYARAKTLHIMVDSCQRVALHLERARKQASAGRPRAALEAVDQARTALTTPMEALFDGADRDLWKATFQDGSGGAGAGGTTANTTSDADAAAGPDDPASSGDAAANTVSAVAAKKKKKLVNLEQTPFGARASIMLPKIENEVLMSARRGLNRWFLALRSGGQGASAGRAVLRQCAYSAAVGAGQLGLGGGAMPAAYVWRAKTADNLMARVHAASGSGKLARAIRVGYWFDRDAPKEAERLEKIEREGVERRAEAIASAFGWYRCWVENSSLLVDPSEFATLAADGMSASGRGLRGSRHGLSGSRHGLSGSRHGRGSRHGGGSRHGKGRSLGFRATTSSRSQAYQEMSTTLGSSAAAMTKTHARSKWCDLMTPDVLNDSSPTRKEEDNILATLPESVHAVRRAELAFTLLGKSDEFVQYYEQNRFGETKIVDKEQKTERKSVLSSLTGDDVTVGTDRVFFAKTLPHLAASVTGFSAVEAALELGIFADDDGLMESTNGNSGNNNTAGGAVASGAASSKTEKPAALSGAGFRESSERYERALVAELGGVFRSRAPRANLVELVRSSMLISVLRGALKIVHPSSTTRRFDKDLLNLDKDILVTAVKLAQDEQLKATSAIVADDPKSPLLVADSLSKESMRKQTVPGIPDPETIGLPFGLSQMVQKPQQADLEFQEQSRTSFNRAPVDEAYTFSQSVPVVLRSIHARAIACAAFALSQLELGQKFPDKKCSPAAGYVLDCVEECVNVAAVGMKDSHNVVEEGSVEKAVQVMANISALQHTLPRLFGTLLRGMCHVGLIQADEIEATFTYAERTLKTADKSCDAQVGSTYSLVYEICRNRIDSHINYALENFQWVAKSTREEPNAYCEGLIGYLRSVFASLGPMDEGSRAGLHFSCMGHVAERLVKLLSGKPGDTTTFDDSALPPITRIDAFGIKNLHTDCEEFERFADSTGVPQLRDCFNELRILTSVMLDKELPSLLLSANASTRRRKYPILSLDKICNILEKYVGTGLGDKLMGGAGRNSDFLFIDKKEVQQLVKIVRAQLH